MNLPVHFGSPHLLLLLLALPAVVLLAKRSLAGLDPIRRTLAVALRLAVVGCLALALAEIEWRRVDDRLTVIFVVDQSLSIPPKQREEALRFVGEASGHLDPTTDEALLIVFGKDASIETKLVKNQTLPTISSVIAPEHTDVSKALRLALASFPQGSRKRIVLVSDGNETRGEMAKEVELARQQGVEVSVLPVHYKYANEALVEKITVPPQAKLEQPFTGRVVIRSFAKTDATLRLYLDGGLEETRAIKLEPGLNVETFQWSLGRAGFFSVEATIETPNDTLYQNNEAHSFVHLQGESKVLYVYGVEGESEPLLEALERERIEVEAIDATAFPFHPTELQSYDAIILDDVPSADLTKQQQSNIEYAVQHLGTGLIMIGGPDSFGAGGWIETPVEDALSVEMEIKSKKIIPKGALAMIMHSCEFADGNTWAVRIVQAAIDKLSKKDEVGVLIYDWQGADKWLFPLQPATNKARLKALCNTMPAGDMPTFDPTMKLAVNGLIKSTATVKHMIILSDGDPQQPSAKTLADAVKHKITISTIAIAPHGGPNGFEVNLMKKIASKTGGKFYLARDPRQLPKIFIKEAARVSRSLILEETFRPRLRHTGEVLKGFHPDDFPPLHGYVMTQTGPGTTKERAQVLLESHKGDPILAYWRYGVGKSIAFTSDARGRWAKDWLAWPKYTNFWAQCVRWASKELDDSPYLVTTSVKGNRGKLILDAVDEDGTFVNHLEVAGIARSPRDKRTKLKLRQTAPGRYEADFDADETGTYTATILTSEPGQEGGESFTTGIVFPYSDEFRRLEANPRGLARAAKRTNGQVIDPTAEGFELASLFEHNLSAEEAFLEGWPWLLALAIGLFPLDVFVRRVMIDYEKHWARFIGVFARILPGGGGPRPPRQATGTLGRLMERKAEVRDERLPSTIAAAGAAAAKRFEARVAADAPGAKSGDQGKSKGKAPAAGAAGGDGGPPKEERLYTSRLLDAKKRALRGQRRPSDGDEKK